MSEVKAKPNKTLIIAVVAAIIVVAGYTSLSSDSEVKIIESKESSLEPNTFKPLTVADVWQGVEVKKTVIPTAQEMTESLKNNTETEEPKEAPITLDYEYIHEEIGKIRLTENGEVVLDEHTLNALRQAFPSSRLKLTPAMLEELQNIMKQGLPGPAGEQAAEIIKNFYDYAIAKKEMAAIYRDINTNLSHEESLAEQKTLRNLYLGEDVANQLFAEEDRSSEYMLKAFEISANKDLTPEEKIKKRNELNHSYIEPLIENWSSRYTSFREDAKAIKDSDKSEEQKAKEIEALKNNQFNEKEQRIIRDGNINLDL